VNSGGRTPWRYARRTCEATVEIDAPAEEVWALISDITRVGEWSVECRSCEWIDDVAEPAPGARFGGRNHRNVASWTRTCEVLAIEKPRCFVWRTLPTNVLPDSTERRFELEGDANQTDLTERFRILQLPGLYERLFALMLPQHHDRTADLEGDLRRIKERVEAGRPAWARASPPRGDNVSEENTA
jgi:uncharacterized membrane protein